VSSQQIRPASDADWDTVRELFSEYQRSVSAPECFLTFEKELAALPGFYASPAGTVLLADGDRGCVGVRPLSGDIAEIKRLYVRPDARSEGLGGRLVEAAIEFARVAGYRAVRLDTLASMASAIHLYERLGFRPIERYNDTPGADTRFYELALD
jgi:putative acetyltransferase